MTTDSTAPALRILDYRTIELSVKAIPDRLDKVLEDSDPEDSEDLSLDDLTIDPLEVDDLDIEVLPFSYDPEESEFVVNLVVELAAQPDRDYPYSFRVELLGFFEFDGDPESEEGVEQLAAGAPSVLYGAAREMIGSATARGPYGSVMLPTVSPGYLARLLLEAMANELKEAGIEFEVPQEPKRPRSRRKKKHRH